MRSAPVRQRNAIDVSSLPDEALGSRAPLWWGVILMTVIEGSMLIILITSYFYLRQNFPTWPPPGTMPPDLLKGSIEMGVLLLSLVPMYIVDQLARRGGAQGKIILWLVVCLIFCLAAVYFRGLEFTGLNCRWDTNAYGSVVWTTLGLHAAHLVASTLETLVFLIYTITHPLDKKHRLDAGLNSVYWYFIVAVWLLCYATIYLSPWLMERRG